MKTGGPVPGASGAAQDAAAAAAAEAVRLVRETPPYKGIPQNLRMEM